MARLKPFLDERNVFRWFIERAETDSQTAEPTGETVTSYFRYEEDFALGLIRYRDTLCSWGVIE
jgi:hypothetical protein